MKKKDNNYIVNYVFKNLIITSSLAWLCNFGGMFVDNLVVLKFLPESAIIAMGIVAPLIYLYTFLNCIFATGAYIYSAQAKGRGEYDKVNNVFTIAILTEVLLGILISIIGFVYCDDIAHLLGAQGDIAAQVSLYIKGYVIFSIAYLLENIVIKFARIDGAPLRFPFYCVLSNAVINVILDIIVIRVWHKGLFELAAVTGVAYTITVLIVCGYFFIGKESTLKLCAIKKYRETMWEIFKLTIPQYWVEFSQLALPIVLNYIFIYNNFLGNVAVYNIMVTAGNFISAPVFGAAGTMGSLAGVFYGERDVYILKAILQKAFQYALIFAGTAATILLIFPIQVLNLLNVSSSSLMEETQFALMIFALLIPIKAVNRCLRELYQNVDRSKEASFMSAANDFIYPIVLTTLLIKPLGSKHVFIVFLISELLGISYVVFCAAKNKKRIPTSIYDYMLLPSNSFDNLKIISESIKNDTKNLMDFVSSISERDEIKELSYRQKNNLELFIEEMGMNIIKHAFNSQGDYWFNVLIINEEDKVTIRTLDNGKFFNPVLWWDSEKNEKLSIGQGLGLKILMAEKNNARYFRCFSLNYFTITISI